MITIMVIALFLVIVGWQVETLIVASFNNISIATQSHNFGNGNYTANGLVSQVGGNLSNFDEYLPFLFFSLSVIVLVLAALLNSHPIGWAIGAAFMIFFIYISIYISNIAHGLLTNPAIAAASAHFPNSLMIAAQLPLYEIVFMFAYLVIIAIRVRFFSPQAQGNQSLSGFQ
jgi:hypothetical protein